MAKKLRLLVINGPNLDMLGVRDKGIYGAMDYRGLVKMIREYCKKKGVNVSFMQSYFEGEIAMKLAHLNQEFPAGQSGLAYLLGQLLDSNKADGIIINAGAYSHYSYAIRDAIELNKSYKLVEVHISDTSKREEFRHKDVIKDVAHHYIAGHGTDGYLEAVDWLIDNVKVNDED